MDKNIYYLIGPVITFSAGFYFYYKRRKFIQSGNKVQGEVIEFDTSGSEKYPVIKFTTLTGETIVKKYKVSQGVRMKVGQLVELHYKAGKPSDFMIDSVSEKWAPLLLITISIVFLIIYVVFFPK